MKAISQVEIFCLPTISHLPYPSPPQQIKSLLSQNHGTEYYFLRYHPNWLKARLFSQTIIYVLLITERISGSSYTQLTCFRLRSQVHSLLAFIPHSHQFLDVLQGNTCLPTQPPGRLSEMSAKSYSSCSLLYMYIILYLNMLTVNMFQKWTYPIFFFKEKIFKITQKNLELSTIFRSYQQICKNTRKATNFMVL